MVTKKLHKFPYNVWLEYERQKQKIKQEAKTPEEYEQKIKELAERLAI